MPFTATTVNSAAAWRPDLYEFAPADALPEALILQCTTQAGSVEGDAKDTENDTGGQVVAGSDPVSPTRAGLPSLDRHPSRVSTPFLRPSLRRDRHQGGEADYHAQCGVGLGNSSQ